MQIFIAVKDGEQVKWQTRTVLSVYPPGSAEDLEARARNEHNIDLGARAMWYADIMMESLLEEIPPTPEAVKPVDLDWVLKIAAEAVREIGKWAHHVREHANPEAVNEATTLCYPCFLEMAHHFNLDTDDFHCEAVLDGACDGCGASAADGHRFYTIPLKGVWAEEWAMVLHDMETR
jgi:hypothetical protein